MIAARFPSRIEGTLPSSNEANRNHEPIPPTDAPYGYDRVAQTTRLPTHLSLTFRQSINLIGFRDIRLWKHALLECWAVSMLVFVFGLLASQLTLLAARDGTASILTVSIVGSLSTAMILPLFIWAAAPDSGGHINPFISMSTFFAGLTSLPQSVLYITGQSIGAIIGGFLLKASLGDDYFASGTIPGCTFDTSLVTIGQVFILETVSAMTLIFWAFGAGLDPRAAPAFGPAVGPALVGLALAVVSFVGAFVKPGYTGASLNPGRCLGLMAPTGKLSYHWIHWVADLLAALINGGLYLYIPSYTKKPRV